MPEDGNAAVPPDAASAVVEVSTTSGAVAPTSSLAAPAGNKDSKWPKARQQNKNIKHADALPITIYHPPPLIPHNPISLLHHLYLFFFPPVVSHTPSYVAYFSPLTSSVHVTDPQSIMELFNRGFWGKGHLSRSEPEWLITEMWRLGFKNVPETSAMITNKRRDKRKAFKKERARKQKEDLARTLAEESGQRKGAAAEERKIVVELDDEIKGAGGNDKESQAISDLSASGVLTPPPSIASDADKDSEAPQAEEEAADVLQGAIAAAPTPPEEAVPDTLPPPSPQPLVKCVRFDDPLTTQKSIKEQKTPRKIPDDREILQLTLQEAFFLHFALGILEIRHADSTETIPTPELLRLFRAYAHFPPQPLPPVDAPLNTDDPFLISYAAYHHFRSLGWVVKAGIKFGVDFMLYNRGPAFNHAEFAVLVVPSYERWGPEKGGRGVGGKMRSWSWLHSVTRLNSQVKKPVVLLYVDVPTAKEVEGWDKRGGMGLKGVLARYGIKEVALKRWVPGRNRD